MSLCFSLCHSLSLLSRSVLSLFLYLLPTFYLSPSFSYTHTQFFFYSLSNFLSSSLFHFLILVPSFLSLSLPLGGVSLPVILLVTTVIELQQQQNLNLKKEVVSKRLKIYNSILIFF